MPVITARVKAGNNYGGAAPAGSLVEVDESELAAVPWCLERYDEPEPEPAPEPAEPAEPEPEPEPAPTKVEKAAKPKR